MVFSPIEKSVFSKSSKLEQKKMAAADSAKAWDYGINFLSPTAGTVRANLRAKDGERTPATFKHLGSTMAGNAVGNVLGRGNQTAGAAGSVVGGLVGTKLSRKHVREGGDRKLIFSQGTKYN